MYNNLTIRARLIAVLSLLSLFLLAVGAAALAGLGKSQGALRVVYEERLVSLGHLDHMMRLILRNHLVITSAAHAAPAALPAAIDQIERNRDAASKVWQQYSEAFVTDSEHEMAARFEAAHEHFMLDALAPALVAAKSGDVDAMRAIVQGPMEHMFPKLREEIDKLIAHQMAQAKAQYGASEAAYARLHWLIVALLAGGLALAAGAGCLLVRGICTPLNHAIAVAQAVAKGDLAQRVDIPAGNEAGKLLVALKEVNDSLARTAGEAAMATAALAASSTHIAGCSLELSERSGEQAGALDEALATLRELADSALRNSENARQVNLFAQHASHCATRGGAAVFQAAEQMAAIGRAADGGSVQGELLALDASLRQANCAMTAMLEAVHRTSGMVNEITAASHEQWVGVEHARQAVAQLDAANRRNAALVDEAATATLSMRQQVGLLSQAMAVFRTAALPANHNLTNSHLPCKTLVASIGFPGRPPALTIRAPRAPRAPGSRRPTLAV